MPLRPSLITLSLLFCAGPALCQTDSVAASDSSGIPTPESAEAVPATPATALPYPLPPPGWFASGELLLTAPRAEGGVSGFLFGSYVEEDVTRLNGTVVPTATLGYRFSGGNALLVSYRFLGTDGSAVPPLAFAQAKWRTNWIDLDYRGCLHGPWLSTTFQWQGGVRLATLSFAEQSRPGDPPFFLDQKWTYFVAGPLFGIDFSHYFGQTGLGVFARGDVGIVLGHILEDTVTANYEDRSPNNSSVGESRGELGVSWSPRTRRWMRFEAGYRDDRFVWSGRHLSFPGPFLRCEIGF
jgi:hypothetical protein